ncbi:MAG: response regulator [Nitrospirae bacterium]|nr:response regulator [Nitrospirota bacterium]MDA8213888.1 response regulator [Nitrospiraceae bacterium]MDA8338563.1 response regulator [Nitrospiraceae bacterium]
MQSKKKRKILIVDDEEVIRTNLSELLKENGYFTDAAVSGRQAIERVTYGDFDIVLLDLMMPVMDGMETLKEIKKIRPKTKVIMITAFATVENAVDAIKNGANDYIPKPYIANELLSTIRRVIEEARFEENLKKLKIEETLFFLSSPIRRNILVLLYSRGSLRLMDITRKLEIDDHTKVMFHLKTLREYGMIDQGEKSYFLTKEGEEIVEFLKILGSYLSE